jgi:hypothetical protein
LQIRFGCLGWRLRGQTMAKGYSKDLRMRVVENVRRLTDPEF